MNPPQTAALVIVDVQAGFINDHSKDAVPPVVRLVHAWVAAGRPVVFTRFYNPPGSPYERVTGWTDLRTPEEQRIVEELTPYVRSAAAVIDKPSSSALTPEFIRLVQTAGWTDLVLAGIDTDACVYDTAIAAYHSGILPWIVTDACASTGGLEYHEAALLLARRNISPQQLLTADELLTGVVGPLEGASQGVQGGH
ncbi:isochorismatase family cysteine hydrolase [Streptomyces sp. NPDC055912]|uniref:isochorismatase family cysteine hydrolase n=1 Tax=Streptomyces sp. NPDC055912 TaxID=3345660 RepID=UPI0035DDFC6C